MSLPVNYKFSKKIAPGKYRAYAQLKGMGNNVSGGGARITISKGLAEKSLIFLKMYFPFDSDPVVATAEVVHSHNNPHKGNEVTVVGVRFLLIDSKHCDKLMEFLVSRSA